MPRAFIRQYFDSRAVVFLLLAMAIASTVALAQTTSGPSTGSESLPVSSSAQTASGDSLGDIARQNRETKAEASTPAKIITNADLPKEPDGYTPPAAEEDELPAPPAASVPSSRRSAQRQAAEQRVAAQWRSRIVAQKNVIANLQSQIEEMLASIHFMDPEYAAHYEEHNYSEGLAYNRSQARQLQRLHQLKLQLDQQTQKLEEMQEAARHAGMHSPTYDP